MRTVILEIIWDLTNFQFKDAYWTWKEMQLFSEIGLVVSAIDPQEQQKQLDEWAQKEPEKKKELVKLICKINGQKMVEEKEIKDIKIDVKSVKILIEQALGIKLSVTVNENKKG